MELITSYASETELSDDDGIENLKTDFFNLKESDEEDEIMGKNDILCQAVCLSEKAYGPTYLPLPEENEIKIQHLSSSSPSSFIKRKNEETFVPTSKRKVSVTEKSNKINSVNTPVCEVEICERDNDNQTENIDSHIEYIFDNPTTICNILNCKNYIPKRQIKLFEAHTSVLTALSWNLAKHSHLLLSSSVDSTLKIWSNILSYKCVRTFKRDHSIKSAKWSLSGTEVICGGYDKKASIFDIGAEKLVSEFPIKDFVSCIQIHTESPDIFLLGTKNNVFAFDKRNKDPQPIRCYYSNCQYVLDLAFMKAGTEFIATTDIVSHDCADRTIMVWDFATGAILSNQVFCECYTCPSVKVSPDERQFVAQTNGNYIAVFSTKRPYKLQQKRCMGHTVSGYNINCDFSPDSQLLVSGDANGGMYFYNSYNCNLIKKIEAKSDTPAVLVNWHPVFNSTVATGFLDGTIQIWQ